MTEWKPVVGYEDYYLVSDQGDVFTKRHNRLMAPQCCRNGYLQVNLTDGEGKHKLHRVHRLVASAFIDNPFGLPEVNHKDCCRTNNRASNLEWCDRTYNNNYGNIRLKIAEKQGKKIDQILDGVVVATWMSEGVASKILNIPQTSISACVRGNGVSAGGFRWRLHDE